MKTKHISREKYIETFCRDKRIRDRQVLYVSAEVHDRIMSVAQLFSKHHVTVTSLIDTILNHHIETHREIFEELKNEKHAAFLEAFNQKLSVEDDEQEFL